MKYEVTEWQMKAIWLGASDAIVDFEEDGDLYSLDEGLRTLMKECPESQARHLKEAYRAGYSMICEFVKELPYQPWCYEQFFPKNT